MRLVYSNPLVVIAAIVSLLALLAIGIVVLLSPRIALPAELPERVAPAAPAPSSEKRKGKKR